VHAHGLGHFGSSLNIFVAFPWYPSESHRGQVVNSTTATTFAITYLTGFLRLRLARTLKSSTAAENAMAK
jgi:hypothetical protein